MTTTTIDLDRQRAEFEATFKLDEWQKRPHPSIEGDYADQPTQCAWTGWQLARRSNAGEAAGIKTWQERMPEHVRFIGTASSESAYKDAEIADLRAALATQQAAREQQPSDGIHPTAQQLRDAAAGLLARKAAREQQEPVGEIVANDPVHGWHMRALIPWDEIGAGAKLYAAPVAQQSEASAPEGFALVPLIPTRAMQRIMDEEGWQWEDLLAAAEAITEEQYNDIQRGTREASSPLEQAAQALGDRAAGHYRNGDYELQDECLRCADVVRDLKNRGDEK